jgi:ribosomal protein S18 acetylase RimI-like enzyme
MTKYEIVAFVEDQRPAYVEDLVRDAMLSVDEAERKTAEDTASLAGGEPDAGHALYVLEDESGRRMGHLWLGPAPGNRTDTAYLYDIEIDAEHRGRGLGREALDLFEREARRRGFTVAGLNVFGSNEVARTLYRSAGYREMFVRMGKRLDDPG